MVFIPSVIEFGNVGPQSQKIGLNILQKQREFETEREFYERGLWQDIARFVNPRREDIRISEQWNDKGKRFGKDVYDGSPLGALNTWADGMQGFLISNRWFKSQMSNPLLNKVDIVREWLQLYDQKMYAAFDRANFYAVLPQWFRDAGSVGTATLFIQEEIGTGRTSYTSIHPREIFIAENMFGEVDTVHRKFMMTARQAVQMFDKNVSSQIGNDNITHPNKKHEFIHAVFPNTDKIEGKRTPSNKKFRSIYLENRAGADNQTVFINRDSGFDINPYVVWRFRKNSDEVYGRSPASDALTEVFSLNQIGMTLLMAAHKSVDPSLNVPSEMRGNVRIEPHGYNYYTDPKRVVTTINQGINYPIGIDQQERLQKSMEDKFRVEFFRAFIGRQGEATATEIQAIKGEQAGLMGAQVDMLYIEGIRKIFDMQSDIEDKSGAFTDLPAIPDEIVESGGTINFILTGPLAQAQRRIRELQPITETMDLLGPTAALLGPEMLDGINKDELQEIIMEAGSFPQAAINSRDRRKEIREERAADLARREQQQLLLEGAKALPGLSKSVEPDSVISTVAGGI